MHFTPVHNVDYSVVSTKSLKMFLKFQTGKYKVSKNYVDT